MAYASRKVVKKIQKIALLSRLLLTFGIALHVTACGGGGSGGGSTVTPPVASTPPVTPPTAPTTPSLDPKPPAPTTPVTPPPVTQAPLFADLRILILGQSISSNCNQHKYDAVANVFQIGKDGIVKVAKDPFEWADCDQGSMWMPLGKNLLDKGIAGKVTFLPIGIAGSSVKEWQIGGKGYDKLNEVVVQINRLGMSFDYAFWHQGSADIGMGTDEYQQRVASIIDVVNSKVKVGRWLVALHSRCLGSYSPEIEQAQRNLGNASSLGRYPGPNTNFLGAEYRMPDNCHLNQAGQEEMATQWINAIVNSMK